MCVTFILLISWVHSVSFADDSIQPQQTARAFIESVDIKDSLGLDRAVKEMTDQAMERPSLVSNLVLFLKTPIQNHRNIRLVAIYILGKMGALRSEKYSELRKTVQNELIQVVQSVDQEESFRTSALMTINDMGDMAHELLDDVKLIALYDENLELRRFAIIVHRNIMFRCQQMSVPIFHPEQVNLDGLLTQLLSADQKTRTHAARRIGQRKEIQAIPAILGTILLYEDHYTTSAAVHALGDLGDVGLGALIGLLVDKENIVSDSIKIIVVDCLGQLGMRAADALKTLIQVKNNEASQSQEEACEALCQAAEKAIKRIFRDIADHQDMEQTRRNQQK